jgi:hypothetical protein
LLDDKIDEMSEDSVNSMTSSMSVSDSGKKRIILPKKQIIEKSNIKSLKKQFFVHKAAKEKA